MKHTCSECKKVFTRKFNRDKHFKKQHKDEKPSDTKNFNCPFCRQQGTDKHFKNKESLVLHVDQNHLDSLVYKIKNSAFKGKLSIFTKELVTLQPLEAFISDRRNLKEILQVISHQLSKFQVIKVALIVTADYRIPSVKQDGHDDNSASLLAEERDNFTLRTKREIFNVNESEKSAKKK